jgi:hypothetical protein
VICYLRLRLGKEERVGTLDVPDFEYFQKDSVFEPTRDTRSKSQQDNIKGLKER